MQARFQDQIQEQRMKASKSKILAVLATAVPCGNAFVSNPQTSTRPFVRAYDARASSLNMLDGTSISDVLSSTSSFLSTIDSDIDSIPTDDFGTVFAGGIAVMLAGVASAFVVGAILERGDNYANVIAESFDQDMDKEAFLNSLTPEDREKAEEMLQKIKDSKAGAGDGEKEEPKPEKQPEQKKDDKKEEISMFSDYD